MLERFEAHNRGIVVFSMAALLFLSILVAGTKLALERPEWGVTLSEIVRFTTLGKVAALFAIGIVCNICLLYFGPRETRGAIALLLDLAVLVALLVMAAGTSLQLLRLLNHTTLSGGG